MVHFKINVQDRKLVHSNNCTVPNKELYMCDYPVPESNRIIYNKV